LAACGSLGRDQGFGRETGGLEMQYIIQVTRTRTITETSNNLTISSSGKLTKGELQERAEQMINEAAADEIHWEISDEKTEIESVQVREEDG
jgi:hypothetical protein